MTESMKCTNCGEADFIRVGIRDAEGETIDEGKFCPACKVFEPYNDDDL